MDVKKTIANVGEKVVDNKSTIFTAVAVVGVGLTALTTAIAAVKLKDEFEKHEGPITKKDAMKFGKIVSVPAVVLIGTTVCIVAAHKADAKKLLTGGAVATLAAKETGSLDTIKEKVTHKTIGEPKTSANDDIPEDKKGVKREFLDEYTGMKITTSFVDLMAAMSKVNSALLADRVMTGNVHTCEAKVFYEALGCTVPNAVWDTYWDLDDGEVSLNFDSILDENYDMITTFRFDRDPNVRPMF